MPGREPASYAKERFQAASTHQNVRKIKRLVVIDPELRLALSADCVEKDPHARVLRVNLPRPRSWLRKHSAHTSWGPPSIRRWSVALTCPLTLFEPSKLKLKNAQSPVATAFDEATRRAGVSAETRRIETDVATY